MSFSYEFVPGERLFALQTFKLDKLVKKYKAFCKQWIKNKKCECVSTLPENHVLNCCHIQKALNEKFKKEEKEIWNLSIELTKGLLGSSKLNQEWLQRLKR